jgi:hypothetical protein
MPLLSLLALCLLLGSAMLFVSLVPLFTASATVTITPTAVEISDTQLRQLAQLIVGKNRQEATTLLLAQRGVSQVAMTVSGMEQTRLPTDAGRIHLLVLSRSA